MSDTVIGVIPARGSSRRVPKKNIKEIGGRPLIAWTIEQAKRSKELDYFFVSTDDPEIAEISKKYGAPVPFRRPPEISSDCDSSFVLSHALSWYEDTHKKVDYVVCLQPTSPFRSASDIDNCIKVARETDADTVVSVTQAKQHPYWCLEMDSVSQRLKPFMDIKLEGDNLVWQNLPFLLYPNGAVYVTKSECIRANKIYGPNLYGYIMPQQRSIDLEEEYDFIVASALYKAFGENPDKWTVFSWMVQ